jgi:hypothetical protein
MKLEFSQHIFKKYSNVNFNENPSIGSQVVQCRWMDSQTDMKLVFTLCICAVTLVQRAAVQFKKYHGAEWVFQLLYLYWR